MLHLLCDGPSPKTVSADSLKQRAHVNVAAVATETRFNHPNPPDGPKALDRFMERAAQRDAQAAAKTQKPKRTSKSDVTPRPSADDLAAFYADLVNSDRYLPVNTINNTTRDAMLARGLVTLERLRMRGVR